MTRAVAGRATYLAAPLVVGMLALWTSATIATAAPRLPVDPGEVLERVTRPADPELARLRARLGAAPGDLATALELAGRYTALARSTQDARYAGYAQAALAPWWDVAEPPAAVLVARAGLRQHRHDFTGALADLDRAALATPRDPRIWLARATILEVIGRPAEALASCGRLYRLTLPIVRVTCHASAMARSGQAEAALAVLDAVGDEARGVPELRAWAAGVRAEIEAGLGRTAEARRSFETALAADAPDAYTTNAYADLLLDTNEPRAALVVLGQDLANDGKLLRRMLALRALGSAEQEVAARLLRQRFAAARWRGDSIAQREEVRFLLATDGDAAAALALAQANFTTQREPWDVRLLLAAALAAGQPAAAAPALAWLAATGYTDVHVQPLVASLREAE